jgi:TRAP-type C4-dicarboxylate transport system permease small subunit
VEKLFKHILNTIFAVEATFCAFCIFFIAASLFADVFLRELFSAPIWGVQRVAVYLLLVMGFFSISIASATGIHLRPRFLDKLVPKSLEKAFIRTGFLIMSATFGFFAYLFFEMTLETIEFAEKMMVVRWPIWYLQAMACYALGSTSFRYLVYAFFPTLAPKSVMP